MSDRWLTDSELGKLLGCSAPAARARAARRRWRRQIGNDGRARTCVPADADLTPTRDPSTRPHVARPRTPTCTPCTSDQEAELLARLDQLRAEMADMLKRLEAAEVLAERLATAEGRAGAAEGELKAVKEERDRLMELLRQDRDRWAAEAAAWRAQTERRPGLLARLFQRTG